MSFSSAPSSEINVTPLIDVLLVLLIIFMVITPRMPRGMHSSVPQGQATEASPAPVTVQLLSSTTHGLPRYSIDGREVAFNDLRPGLQSTLAARQDRTVFVRASRSLDYQPVATIVSQAKLAGATQIALSGQ